MKTMTHPDFARPFRDLRGQSYGTRIVLEYSHRYQTTRVWIARCRCGWEGPVLETNLRRATACLTCAPRGPTKAHPTAAKRDYSTWRSIQHNATWPDVAAFLKDMADLRRPEHKALCRRDTKAPHGPANSFWSTRTQSALNKINAAVAALTARGVPEADARQRVAGLSRQRQHQLIAMAAARCRQCGAASGGKSLCKPCMKKAAAKARAKRAKERGAG